MSLFIGGGGGKHGPRATMRHATIISSFSVLFMDITTAGGWYFPRHTSTLPTFFHFVFRLAFVIVFRFESRDFVLLLLDGRNSGGSLVGGENGVGVLQGVHQVSITQLHVGDGRLDDGRQLLLPHPTDDLLTATI